MKKITLVSILLLSLVLAGCSTAQTGTSPSVDASASVLPTASRLILGTLKLEGTQDAVTAEQAAELLPLWQVYEDLNSSDTAAEAEVNALVAQIEETMTPGQVKAIDAMGLTQSDIAAVMADQKLVEALSGTAAGTSASRNEAPQGGPGGNLPPDMGGDSAMGAAGMEPVSTSNGSAQSAAAQPGGGSGIPSVLVNALIQLLESRGA
ncbi:MAG: hypothetical protein ACM3QS_15315 [Bacteroidota bacterium]